MSDQAEREPALEALLRNAASNGWDFFDDAARAQDGAKQVPFDKVKRLGEIAAALATVPEFVELLEHILDQTLRRATFVSSLGVPMDQGYAYGMFREGQNSLAMMILKMIAAGRKQAAPPPRDAPAAL